MAHLFGGKRYAQRQVIFLTKGDALIHQRFVLFLIILRTLKIALSRQGNDLFADKPLLVIPVAQTFKHIVSIAGKGIHHVIGAQPFFLVSKARIGFHQIGAGAFRMRPEQAVIRQAGVRPDGANNAFRTPGFHFECFTGGQGNRTRWHGQQATRVRPGIRYNIQTVCTLNIAVNICVLVIRNAQTTALPLRIFLHRAGFKGDGLDHRRRDIISGINF